MNLSCEKVKILFLESVKSTPSHLTTKIYTMKKLYSLVFAACLGVATQAQVDVTFNVDMNGQTVSANGVHLAGEFNNPAQNSAVFNDAYANWNPGSIEMSDIDMDGIYSVTLQLLPATYRFKFVNDNDWAGVEDVPGACQVEAAGDDNRYIVVSDATSYSVAFGSCAPAGQKTVRVRVNMGEVTEINPVGVYVAGDFQGWDPSTTMLTDAQPINGSTDGIYEGIFNVDQAASIEYKFVNGNDWLYAETVPSTCGVGPNSNRFAELPDLNTVLDAVAFGSCAQVVQVTFRVNTSLQTVGANGVHVAGSFQGWAPGDAAWAMDDSDGDGIYELTAGISPGDYQYKFVLGNSWSDPNESLPSECNVGGNRSITVGTDAMTVEYCYNQCTMECIADPDPADITFRVNMMNTPVATEGVWMIGGFTNPVWQAGATQMTDPDGDGVYECTVTVSGTADIQYKFMNGDVNNPANEEAAGIAECGIDNGVGGYNRTHTRTGVAEVLPTMCFDACADCIISVNENEIVTSLVAFPVPAEEILNLNFSSANAETLNFRLINAMGQVVSTSTIARTQVGVNRHQIDVSGLAAGIYSLEINNANSARTIVVSVR